MSFFGFNRQGVFVIAMTTLAVVCCSGGQTPRSDGGTKDGTASAGDESRADDAPAGVVELAIEIHVEGWTNEIQNSQAFIAHSEAVDVVASAAAGHGAVLSIGLSAKYAEAASKFGTDYIERWIDMGHGISYHADIGGTGQPTLQQLTSALSAYKAVVDSLGVNSTPVVSGVCSPGPWVEAALAAGFELACGIVEYCLTSLDPENIPPDKQYVKDCAGPADCHGPAISDLSKALHPWFTSSSSNWLQPDPQGRLAVVVSMGGVTVPCMAEGSNEACSADTDDVSAFAREISEAAAYTNHPGPTVLLHSWSIGTPVDGDFAEALFGAADDAITSGKARWRRLDDIPALIPR